MSEMSAFLSILKTSSLVFLILVSIFVASSSVSALSLDCPSEPVNKDYGFSWGGSEKVEMQISNNIYFSEYVKIKSKESPIFIEGIYDKIFELALNSRGKLYIRVVSKDKFKGYSNVCEFELEGIEFLDGDNWVYDDYTISNEVAKGKRALKIPASSNLYLGPDLSDTTIFNQEMPYDLHNAIITTYLYTPKNCKGGYGKNYAQIHVKDINWISAIGDTLLFRHYGWKELRFNFNSMPLLYFNKTRIRQFIVKIGTYGKCKGDFYLDNFIIEKDGKFAVWNFE